MHPSTWAKACLRPFRFFNESLPETLNLSQHDLVASDWMIRLNELSSSCRCHGLNINVSSSLFQIRAGDCRSSMADGPRGSAERSESRKRRHVGLWFVNAGDGEGRTWEETFDTLSRAGHGKWLWRLLNWRFSLRRKEATLRGSIKGEGSGVDWPSGLPSCLA